MLTKLTSSTRTQKRLQASLQDCLARNGARKWKPTYKSGFETRLLRRNRGNRVIQRLRLRRLRNDHYHIRNIILGETLSSGSQSKITQLDDESQGWNAHATISRPILEVASHSRLPQFSRELRVQLPGTETWPSHATGGRRMHRFSPSSHS